MNPEIKSEIEPAEKKYIRGKRNQPKRKKKVENYRMPSEKKVMQKISRKYHDQLKKRATTDIKNEYRKNETRVARAESKVKYMFTMIIFEAIVIGILLIDFYLK